MTEETYQPWEKPQGDIPKEIIQILEPVVLVLPNQKTDDIAKLNHIEWQSEIQLRAKAYRYLKSKNPERWTDWLDGSQSTLSSNSIEKRDGKWSKLQTFIQRHVNCEDLTTTNKSSSSASLPQASTAKSTETVTNPNPDVVCPNNRRIKADLTYPPAALKEGVTGSFIVEFTIGPNGIKNPIILGQANRYLAEAALNAVRQFSCIAQPSSDVKVQVPFDFKLE